MNKKQMLFEDYGILKNDKDTNIIIIFTSIFDYIRDKDIEIENWRLKHLKELKIRKHYEELIARALDILKTTYDVKDYEIIEDVTDMLEKGVISNE